MEKLLLNIESGLLMKVTFGENWKLLGVFGKFVQVEQCEFDTLRIGDNWYTIDGYQDGLAILYELEGPQEEDPKPVNVDEEWDKIHKTLWDNFSGKFSPELINKLADTAMEGMYGEGVLNKEEDCDEWAKVLTLQLYFDPNLATDEDEVAQGVIRGVDKAGYCVGSYDWEIRRV